MDTSKLNAAQNIFARNQAVKLAYIFGSQARGEGGPASDYDFAVYLDHRDPKMIYDLQGALSAELSRALGTDAIDLIILDRTDNPELKYRIISEGKLLHKVEPYQVLFEPLVLNEYFDFRDILSRHGLTHASR